MGKKKRRRRKPTARPSRKVDLLADILGGHDLRPDNSGNPQIA